MRNASYGGRMRRERPPLRAVWLSKVFCVLKIVDGIYLIDGFVMTTSLSKIEGDGENPGAWKSL